MGIFSKFEQRLAGSVNSAFAKAFRAEVQPVELASAIRSAMDERAAHMAKGQRPIVPNLFDIELSSTDYERLVAHEAELTDELRASANEHAETQRYTPGGPIALSFTCNDELETGVFRLRPHTARQVDQAREQPRFGQYAEPTSHAPQDDALAVWAAASQGRRSAPPAPAPKPEPAADQAPEVHDERAPAEEAPRRRFQLPGWARPSAAEPEPIHTRTTHDAPVDVNHVADARDDECIAERSAYDPRRPSPAAPRAVRQRPWLELDGERYPLIGAITVIGRDDDADIILDDPGVSRRHSEVRVTTDGPHLVVTLRDMQSTNGTFVDGNQITRHHLVGGERITVGRTSFVFHAGGDK